MKKLLHVGHFGLVNALIYDRIWDELASVLVEYLPNDRTPQRILTASKASFLEAVSFPKYVIIFE